MSSRERSCTLCFLVGCVIEALLQPGSLLVLGVDEEATVAGANSDDAFGF